MIIDSTSIYTSPVRTIRGRAELYNGSALLDCFNHDDALISFNIERMGEENKFFGFGICQKATVHLRDKDRNITIDKGNQLKLYVQVGDGAYINNSPTFYVESVVRDENTNQLTVTAYDKLYDAVVHTVSEVGLDDYTILEFTQAASNVIGCSGTVILGIGSSETCFSTYYSSGANFDGSESLADAFRAISEVTQTVYYINSSDALVFKRLDKSGAAVLTITKSNYMTLSSEGAQAISNITHTTELGNNYTAGDNSGALQYVRDNPFWNALQDNEISSLLNAAVSAISGLSITPFNCEWRGNYLLEVGDKIALQAKNNEVITSYLLNDTITYSGGLKQQTAWTYSPSNAETASNPTNISDAINKTYAIVDKVNQTIDLVTSEVTENSNKIAQIELDLDSITSTVSSTQTTVTVAKQTADEAKATAESASAAVEEAIAAAEGVTGIANEAKEAADEAKNTADSVAVTVTTLQTQISQTAEELDLKASKEEVTTINGKVTENSNKIAQIEIDIESITSTVSSTQTVITEVQTTANNAQSTANSANTTANNAQSTANSASEAASQAQTTANNANTTANSAQTTANNANTTANEAKDTAESTKTTVTTLQTQVAQNTTDITLKASKDELTTIDGKVTDNTTAIAALELTTEGLNTSVENTTSTLNTVTSQMETLTNRVNASVTASEVTLAIETELSKGTNSVVTSTGYTLDSDGLNVSKSDSEMSTLVSDDGMTVCRSGEQVLTANNQGVKAENLHATTYLIVGNNSRFEDYGTRTGCFWIG